MNSLLIRGCSFYEYEKNNYLFVINSIHGYCNESTSKETDIDGCSRR